MKFANNKTGILGEQIAAKFLLKNGYSIVEKNFKVNFGEIDIIAYKNDIIHFVEVKARYSPLKVMPYEQVNQRKINKLIKLSSIYTIYKKLNNYKQSIDVISIIFNNKTNDYELKMFENVIN